MIAGAFNRLACWAIGHKYRLQQEFSPETRRVVCCRCAGDWAMNDRVNIIVPWNGEFAEFYERRGHVILAKSAPSTLPEKNT